MIEYIEREAAYRFAQDQWKKETGAYSKGWNNALGVMKGALHNNDAIPAADVVPVRHGRWIKDGDEGPVYCSECGEEHEWEDYRASYCDCCGAKMDKDGD